MRRTVLGLLAVIASILFVHQQWTALHAQVTDDGPPPKPPVIDGSPVAEPPLFVDPDRRPRVHASTVTMAPVIDIWYGSEQHFGYNGEPLEWVNVLGNVSAAGPIATLEYRLNGASARPLSLGPNNRRLALPGDFNVEIAYADLAPGNNHLEITATDDLNRTTVSTVTLHYTSTVQGSLPYEADWSGAAKIEEVGQVVDGLWAIEGATVRPLVLDYDRLIALGDIDWTDYEVTVPVTIHGIDAGGFDPPSNGPGVGLLFRWQGHFNWSGEQPNNGWQRLGALGWFRWSRVNDTVVTRMQMLGQDGRIIQAKAAQPQFGKTYYFKMRVETMQNGLPHYQLKVWESTQTEPIAWDLAGNGLDGEPTRGSILLVAHHVDASFGTVSIQPISTGTLMLSASSAGNGSVDVSPQRAGYHDGEEITLTAAPDIGYGFDAWIGDFTGSANPLVFDITANTAVTATFAALPDVSLTISPTIHGTVTAEPQKAGYAVGETVTLRAMPDSGYALAEWGGDLAGNDSPYLFQISEDTLVAPRFEMAREVRSDDFNSCALDDSLWTFVDPQSGGSGASTMAVDGKRLVIAVPGGANHDVWTAGIQAPHLLQVAGNQDFELETKFESSVVSAYQLQGLLIMEDAVNFLRVNFQHDGTDPRLLGIRFVGGTPTIEFNRRIAGGNAPPYLRVTRTGDTWQAAYSFDGSNWTAGAGQRINHDLVVSNVGIFAGNAGAGGPAPPLNMQADYFMNSANRIQPEDARALTPADLAVQATPDSGGTIAVTSTAAGGCGDTLRLTALPAQGWRFEGWSSAGAGTLNPLEGQFATSDLVEARFVPLDQPSLTTSIVSNGEGEGGTVSRDPDKLNYFQGEIVRLVAEPTIGWQFDGWSGDLSGSMPVQDVTMTASTWVTATFSQARFPLNLRTAGLGSGSVDAVPDQESYVYGQSVRVVAEADSGSIFGGWVELNDAVTSTVMLTMTAPTTMTARFEPQMVAVNTSTQGRGTVMVAPDASSYSYGETIAIRAQAEDGWIFVGWAGDIAGSEEILTIDLRADLTAIAVFEPLTEDSPYRITTATAGAGSGEIVVTPQKSAYAAGDIVTLEAVALDGSRFAGWAGDLTGTANPLQIVVRDSLTVLATFDLHFYSLQTSVDGAGHIEVAPNQSAYRPGDTVTLRAVPDVGWRFVGWTGDATGSANPLVTAMDGDRSIQAIFSPIRLFLPLLQ